MSKNARGISDVRQTLIGLDVSHVWRGYGSAIFLEFGELTPRKRLDGSHGAPCGELTLGIEWNWRFELPRSILGGAWSDQRRWSGFFHRVLGATVVDLQAVGVLPEIEVSFSNGIRLCSFMNDAGQPQWHIISRRSSPTEAWRVERGRVVHSLLSDKVSKAVMRIENEKA